MRGEIPVERRYRIALNEEKQYCVWPVDRAMPGGWHPEGTEGTKQQCLDRVAELWQAILRGVSAGAETPGVSPTG